MRHKAQNVNVVVCIFSKSVFYTSKQIHVMGKPRQIEVQVKRRKFSLTKAELG